MAGGPLRGAGILLNSLFDPQNVSRASQSRVSSAGASQFRVSSAGASQSRVSRSGASQSRVSSASQSADMELDLWYSRLVQATYLDVMVCSADRFDYLVIESLSLHIL